jgi:hypothetical protein
MSKSKPAKLRANGRTMSMTARLPRKEMVAHPDHYNRGGVECMQVSAAMVTGWSPQAAYRLGQAHDYIFRHAHKGQPVQDLEKAVFWIQQHIAALKAEAAAGAAS